MRRPALALAGLLLPLTALAACGGDETATDPAADAAPEGPPCSFVADGEAAKKVDLPPDRATATGDVAVSIATSQGDLAATLDGTRAPCTVTSFVSLAEQGYFDDTPCHRLTTEGIYVLQCGDPLGQGYGGPGYTVPDEYDGTETYPAGTLAMANTGAPDTGGSQFFIVYEDTQLPPAYTVFGTVDAAAVAAIQTVAAGGSEPPGDGAPTIPVTITGVTVS